MLLCIIALSARGQYPPTSLDTIASIFQQDNEDIRVNWYYYCPQCGSLLEAYTKTEEMNDYGTKFQPSIICKHRAQKYIYDGIEHYKIYKEGVLVYEQFLYNRFPVHVDIFTIIRAQEDWICSGSSNLKQIVEDEYKNSIARHKR